jgi:hypothetical protein
MGGFNSVTEGLPSGNSTITSSGVPLGNAAGDGGSGFAFTPASSVSSDSGSNWASQAFAPAAAMTQQMPEQQDVRLQTIEPDNGTDWKPNPAALEKASRNLLEDRGANRSSGFGSYQLAENDTNERKVNPIVSKLAREHPENPVHLRGNLLGAPEEPKQPETKPGETDWRSLLPKPKLRTNLFGEPVYPAPPNLLREQPKPSSTANSAPADGPGLLGPSKPMNPLLAEFHKRQQEMQQENAARQQTLDGTIGDWWGRYKNRIENNQAETPTQSQSEQANQTEQVKAKEAFDPIVGDKSTPPAYKKGYLSKQPGVWEGFNKAADRLPEAGENQKFTLGQIFAAEGGTAKDPESNASSGILQNTLDSARKRVPGLESAKTPSDLTLDQRTAVMKDYFDQSLRTIGGARALDALPSKEAAAAFGDAIYRHGPGDGAEAIQRAINAVEKGRVAEDGKMGPETFKAFQTMANEPKAQSKLLYYLSQE